MSKKTENSEAVATEGSDASGPRSPTRTLRILELIAENNNNLTLAQVSQHLSIPKTSLLSLLRSLVAQNYLISQAGKYRLGSATYRLTFMINRNPFIRTIRPALERVAQSVGETVSFCMFDASKREVEYSDLIESARSIRYVVDVGTTRPLYCVAAGLAILAWQDPEWIENYLDTIPLKQITAATVIDKASIIERLREIRTKGYAISAGEFSEDVFGFAAPVFSHPGQVSFAIGIGAPSVRAFSKKEEYAKVVHDEAAAISLTLQGGDSNSS